MSFDPVYTARSNILIVGTWPSPKSREQGFFYGHPQNRFWPMLAALMHAPTPETIEQKTRLICDNDLALWDTIESCTITGASDASIRDVVPTDLAWLCRQAPIERIVCNGATAYRLCVQYHHLSGVQVLRLPSTSPANAAWSMKRLLEQWGPALARREEECGEE